MTCQYHIKGVVVAQGDSEHFPFFVDSNTGKPFDLNSIDILKHKKEVDNADAIRSAFRTKTTLYMARWDTSGNEGNYQVSIIVL